MIHRSGDAAQIALIFQENYEFSEVFEVHLMVEAVQWWLLKVPGYCSRWAVLASN